MQTSCAKLRLFGMQTAEETARKLVASTHGQIREVIKKKTAVE